MFDREIGSLNSEEFQEIISKEPSWAINNGFYLMSAIVALAFLFIINIQYTETISFPVTVTPLKYSTPVLSERQGTIVFVFSKELSSVGESQRILTIRYKGTGTDSTLLAPYSGTIYFGEDLINKKIIDSGSTLFQIADIHNGTNIKGNILAKNFTKIIPGQEALIKIENYPYTEYGELKAKVTFVGKILKSNRYNVNLTLVDGFKTNYSKQISVLPVMHGTADVFIKKSSLFQKIFGPLFQKRI